MLGLQPGEEPRTWPEFEHRFLGHSAPDPVPNAGLNIKVIVSGVERRIAVLRRPVPDNSGRMAGILHDRTHSERREAELLQAVEWRDRLQQLGRWSLLGEIASGLAHELNQPLAAISAFAQAGERMLNLPQPKVAKAGTLLREISEQALRAGDVIHRMRGLIKRQGSEPQLLTCLAILSDFRALADPIARAHHVRFEVALPAADLKVSADPSHIQQVLMSLFRNALDAVRDAPLATKVVQARADLAGDTVEFSVLDNGPGISESVARELFRPFYSTKPEGTGLGLSVCRSIIGEYGGTLRFTNANPGACFIVGLPLSG
ncbi:MAG: ATP-binding protein [Steroidobacteraceae bacterium]